jgi:hypothetical protein
MKVKINIDITKAKPKVKKVETDENKKEDTKEDIKKKSPLVNYIKKMSLTQKIIAGGVITAIIVASNEKRVAQQQLDLQKLGDTIYENTVSEIQDANNYLNSTSVAKAEATIPIQPSAVVEANTLITKYANADSFDKEKAVDKDYKDKYIEVVGKVSSLDEDGIIIKNTNEISDKWYANYMKVECNFQEPDLSKVKGYTYGEDVAVIGYCKGLDGLSIELDNCQLKR